MIDEVYVLSIYLSNGCVARDASPIYRNVFCLMKKLVISGYLLTCVNRRRSIAYVRDAYYETVTLETYCMIISFPAFPLNQNNFVPYLVQGCRVI